MSALLIGMSSGATSRHGSEAGSRLAHPGVRQPGLDAGDDHFAVVPVGVRGSDVVAELGGLGDAVLHVGPAVGVVDRARLLGDDRAHHAAGHAVQDTQVEPALLVELVREVQLAPVHPLRRPPGVFDEAPQLRGKPPRQLLVVLGPLAQQLVDPGHFTPFLQRPDQRVGDLVPDPPGVLAGSGARDGAARRPRPGRRGRGRAERAEGAQRAAGKQHLASAQFIHVLNSSLSSRTADWYADTRRRAVYHTGKHKTIANTSPAIAPISQPHPEIGPVVRGARQRQGGKRWNLYCPTP